MTRRSIKFAGAVAIAAVSLVVGVAPASAVGMTGPYISGEANCEPGRIWVTPPQISPSVSSYSNGNIFVLGGSQRVGFRAHLARFDETRRQWVTVASGSWKVKDVPLQGDPAINWYLDLSTGTWGSGGNPFTITRPGSYAVFFELYWYANEYVSSGYLSTWAFAHREFRYATYNLAAYDYCVY